MPNRGRLRAAHGTDLPFGVLPVVGVVLRERWRLSAGIGLQHITADAILGGLDDLGLGRLSDKTVAWVSLHVFLEGCGRGEVDVLPVLVAGKALVIGPPVGERRTRHDMARGQHFRIDNGLAVVREANGAVVSHLEVAMLAHKRTPLSCLVARPSSDRQLARSSLAGLAEDGAVAELEAPFRGQRVEPVVSPGDVDALGEFCQGFLNVMSQPIGLIPEVLSELLVIVGCTRPLGFDLGFELVET